MDNVVKEEVVNELHKPARKNYKRRRVITKGIYDLWAIDLVELIPHSKINKGYKYILVCINVFSKYVWCEPLKNKTGREVAVAMEKILMQNKIKPKNIQSDGGGEFFNSDFKKVMEKWNINHYRTFSNVKAAVVERVNRTLKNKMWKRFSLQGNYKWLDLLPAIVKEYNASFHRTIKMAPKDVKKKDEKNLLNTVYSHIKTVDPKKIKFKLDDYVRVSKYREAFQKGYIPQWSNEIFRISKINRTNPTTYILNDLNDQTISGGFYQEEIQKVKYPDVYLIEKVLRRKNNKLYVKFLGLSNKHNTWLTKSQLL